MSGKKKVVKKKVDAGRKISGRAKRTSVKAGEVHIDFPREDDVLPTSGHYAVRIGGNTNTNTSVEVSFDNKKWFQCRQAAGYYWFDWYPTKIAGVTLVARCKNGGRAAKRSAPRKVRIAG
ncbi:MAG: hypothetical protein COB53_12760 [Elusimicrobia bacterium]|nr:MAG: hypothetical protein COB53_12760 [Elusimicrobiota bacterium]